MTAVPVISIPLHDLHLVKVEIVNDKDAFVEPVLGYLAKVNDFDPHSRALTLGDLDGEIGRDDELFAECLAAGGAVIVDLERVRHLSPTAARVLLTRGLQALEEKMSPRGWLRGVAEASVAELNRIQRARRSEEA
jgi:hypothetical protein